MKTYLGARKKVILVGVLVMALTTIPYLIAYFFQGDAWRFTGFLIAVEDGNSYIAKMLTGAGGSWLFRSPYSAERQTGALIFFPYLLIGKLASGAALHEQLVALYHGYRFVAGVLAALAVNDFLLLFIKKERPRMGALVVILAGGGLGWIITIAGLKNFLGSIPLDFLSPESFGFLSLFGLPHLVMGRALMLWGAAAYLDQGPGYKAGILWLLMGLFQPLFIVVIWVVCGLHAIMSLAWSWRIGAKEIQAGPDISWLKKAITAGLVSSPMVIYNAALFYIDPYLNDWTSKMDLASPHWLHYLIAYGAVLPLAVLGLREALKTDHSKGLFLTCWLAAAPILISAPVNPQRRLAEGIWVVLVTAMYLFFSAQNRMPTFGKFLIASLFPTTIFILWGASGRAAIQAEPVFRSAAEVEAYQFLADLVPPEAVILSSFDVGNSLPAWAPVRVVQGHGAETVNLDRWQNDISRYFSATQGRIDCGDFFNNHGIDFLFWGPAEEIQWSWDPDIKSCLERVYNSSGYSIYQVSH